MKSVRDAEEARAPALTAPFTHTHSHISRCSHMNHLCLSHPFQLHMRVCESIAAQGVWECVGVLMLNNRNSIFMLPIIINNNALHFGIQIETHTHMHSAGPKENSNIKLQIPIKKRTKLKNDWCRNIGIFFIFLFVRCTFEQTIECTMHGDHSNNIVPTYCSFATIRIWSMFICCLQ